MSVNESFTGNFGSDLRSRVEFITAGAKDIVGKRGSIVIEATSGRPLYGNRPPRDVEVATLVELPSGDVNVRLDKYETRFFTGIIDRRSRGFWVREGDFGALAQAVIANWSDRDLKTALNLIQGPLEKITGKTRDAGAVTS